MRVPTPWLFLAPTLAVMAVLFFWPLWQAASMSLADPATGSSLSRLHYQRVLTDPRFGASLWISVLYTVGVVAGSLAAGMGVALLLDRALAARALLRALFVMPWAMPFVATALIWRWMLDPQYGVLTYLLDLVGVGNVNAFGAELALLSVSLIEVWKTFPLAAIMFLAAMQAIPRELHEAAALDGAGTWQRFRHVTVPGLRHTTRVLSLLLTLWVFGRAFMVIFLTTGGGPAGATETVVLLTYLRGFGQFDLGGAAALGMVVLLIATVLTVAYLRTARDDR
jgi:multiple sugar transport system permease protein